MYLFEDKDLFEPEPIQGRRKSSSDFIVIGEVVGEERLMPNGASTAILGGLKSKSLKIERIKPMNLADKKLDSKVYTSVLLSSSNAIDDFKLVGDLNREEEGSEFVSYDSGDMCWEFNGAPIRLMTPIEMLNVIPNWFDHPEAYSPDYKLQMLRNVLKTGLDPHR